MKKVLLVEDDPIVTGIYKSRLEKEGFEVEVSTNGQDGYYLLYNSKPDALLLDLMLPKMNGIELLKKIRAIKEFEKLPILVFTNAYVANMIHEAFAAGATAVYNKACVTPRQIVDVLRSFEAGNFCTPVARPQTQTSTLKPGGSAGSAGPQASASKLVTGDDKAFEAELLRSFRQTSASSISDMRKKLQDITKAQTDTARNEQLDQLYRKVGSYAANGGMAGLAYVAKLGAALECMLKELLDKPKSVTPSTLRTAAHALDALGDLASANVKADFADNPPIQLLVADDEMLSRRAIVYALEKAALSAVAVESADQAMAKAANTRYDLIFLDVNMPGTNGFAACEKMKAGGVNQTTPIVFVTSTADFQARAQCTLRGATDLIAKPFMFIELTVKALTFSLRARLEQVARAKAPTPVEPVEVIL
jgi:CheY-like chemotaxis protein